MNQITKQQFVLLRKNDAVCYRPFQDETGTIKFSLWPYITYDGKTEYGATAVLFNLMIVPQDDPPTLVKNVPINLPSIPNKWMSSYSGYSIQDIIVLNKYIITNVDLDKEIGN